MTQKELQYVNYIADHITNVYLAYHIIGNKLKNILSYDNLDLIRRIYTHDVSKWSDDEFEGYRQWFYPDDNEDKNKRLFNLAWEHHYKNNDHHPEYWGNKPMPDIAIAEMLCDWLAMSLRFRTSLEQWYKTQFEKQKLNEVTLKQVETLVPICEQALQEYFSQQSS